jgi:hypothetical protein
MIMFIFIHLTLRSRCDRLSAARYDASDELSAAVEAGAVPAGVKAMKTIRAIWKVGQILPTQSVDWPEGTALAVESLEESTVSDAGGDLLGDDPASIARWLAWFYSLEPPSVSHFVSFVRVCSKMA